MNLQPYFDEGKVILQVSGGRDSLACWALTRPWHKHENFILMWGDTGDAYPEVTATVAWMAQGVRRFEAVQTDVRGDVAENGWPVDLLPVWRTPLGHAVQPKPGPRLRAAFDCCRANLWSPLDEAVRRLGGRTVIRGQRTAESMRAPVPPIWEHNGVRYVLPIHDWSLADVWECLESQGIPEPAYYEEVSKGLDCLHCTAYLGEAVGRGDYLRRNHPEVAAALAPIYSTILDAQLDELLRTQRSMKERA